CLGACLRGEGGQPAARAEVPVDLVGQLRRRPRRAAPELADVTRVDVAGPGELAHAGGALGHKPRELVAAGAHSRVPIARVSGVASTRCPTPTNRQQLPMVALSGGCFL